MFAINPALDITTVVPTPATSPAYNFTDLFSNQTIGGNKNFTGTTSFGAVAQLNLSAVNGIINVRDYGAKGDGVSDDAVAIQAALTDAFNQNKEVFFPSIGNAIYGSTIYLTSKLSWQGVSLIGPDCSGANPIGLPTHGCVVIQSKPGQDIFASLSPTDPAYLFVYQNFLVSNLAFVVDDSVDVSTTVGGTRFLGKTEYDGTCTSGTALASSSNSMWSQGDVGHGLRLVGAGAAGVDLVTTIASVNRNTAVATLATNCLTTVTTAKVYTSVTGTSTIETAGNCAIAVPVRDGAVTDNGNPGFQKATFMNVSFMGLSGANLGQNHSCGIYTNATPYGTTFQNIQFSRLWLGYGDAPPPVNPNSQDWAADANHWMDFTANNTNYPLIEYDSSMSEFDRIDLYSGHGFYFLGEKVFTRFGNSQISLNDYYDEANTPITSGPHSWFTGTGFVVQGGQLLSGASAGNGTVQWDASEGVINDTSLAGDGISNVLNITGSMNRVLAYASSVTSSVGDTGLSNEIVVMGYSNIPLNHLAHIDHSMPPTGQLDTYSILNGNAATTYDSMSDLLLTPAEMQGVNEATRVITPDAAVPLTRAYYSVPANGGFSVGGSNGTGNGSYFVVGTSIPAGKIRVYVFGKASAGCTQAFSLFDLNSATVWSAPGTLTWTTSYALGTTSSGDYFDADLTAAVAGHHVAFSGGSCGTSTINLGWIALRPWKGDEEVNGPITALALRTGQAANTDLAGQITITSSTTGTYTFASTALTSAPVCSLTPVTDPTVIGGYWATATPTIVTAHVKTSGTITFNYVCAVRN